MNFIILKMNGPTIELIESVWSTRALAKAAIVFHMKEAGLKATDYKIIQREVNTLKGRRGD